MMYISKFKETSLKALILFMKSGVMKPQTFTKYLRVTLVNSLVRERFNFCFQELFASINKIFILVGRLGIGLSFYGVLRFS